MATWWSRLLGRNAAPEAEYVPAEETRLATAREFLRPSLDCYQLPDQAAQAKAWALLKRALTPQQLRDLLANRCFYVRGKMFTYRIREGHSGNVDALDPRGYVVSRFCAHPLGRVPVYDMMLAQKLWIETDEIMFLEEAAPYPLRY